MIVKTFMRAGAPKSYLQGSTKTSISFHFAEFVVHARICLQITMSTPVLVPDFSTSVQN